MQSGRPRAIFGRCPTSTKRKEFFMDNQGKANISMVSLGVVAILLCACVGVLSPPAYLGVLGGVALIWAAFPKKRPEDEGAKRIDEVIDGVSTSTGINLKLD